MLVLWVIVVLSAVAARIATVARAETRLVETIRARTVARYAAESGVVAAQMAFERLLRVAGTPGEQARLFQRLDDEVSSWGVQTLGDARYQVVVTDLGARVDLTRSGAEVMHGLFAQFVSEREATALVDALRDWTDPDGTPRPSGAEISYYRGVGSPFTPPNAPLLRLDDLTRIVGFDDEIALQLAPFITVRGNGRINVNTAPAEVLAALPQLGQRAREVVLARERGMFFESPAELRRLFEDGGGPVALQLRLYTTMPERVLVVSRGWLEGHPLTHEVQAVLTVGAPAPTGDVPVRLLYWTEKDR